MWGMASTGVGMHALSGAESEPVTFGRLLDFTRDPLACMRRLYRDHGTVAALEENGKRLVFVFGPEHNNAC